MKSIAAVAAVAFFAAGVAAQSTSCTINTPEGVAECVPIQFTWNGGTAPYFLSIEPGSDPSAAALQLYGPLSGTSLTWPTNITQGTSLGLTLRDSNGVSCQSGTFTINPGTTSCLSAGGSSASSGASSTAPAASSSAAASSAHSSASSAGSSASSAASSASSAAASATHSTSGAGMNMASLSVAGVVVAFVAAALA